MNRTRIGIVIGLAVLAVAFVYVRPMILTRGSAHYRKPDTEQADLTRRQIELHKQKVEKLVSENDQKVKVLREEASKLRAQLEAAKKTANAREIERLEAEIKRLTASVQNGQ